MEIFETQTIFEMMLPQIYVFHACVVSTVVDASCILVIVVTAIEVIGDLYFTYRFGTSLKLTKRDFENGFLIGSLLINSQMLWFLSAQKGTTSIFATFYQSFGLTCLVFSLEKLLSKFS